MLIYAALPLHFRHHPLLYTPLLLKCSSFSYFLTLCLLLSFHSLSFPQSVSFSHGLSLTPTPSCSQTLLLPPPGLKKEVLCGNWLHLGTLKLLQWHFRLNSTFTPSINPSFPPVSLFKVIASSCFPVCWSLLESMHGTLTKTALGKIKNGFICSSALDQKTVNIKCFGHLRSKPPTTLHCDYLCFFKS